MTLSRKSDPDPNAIPLDFKIPARPSNVEPSRKTPVAAHAWCGHHKGGKRTGLVISGQHMVWKVHYVRVGRTSTPCRASGVALCVAPARDGVMELSMTPQKRTADPMHGMRNARCMHPQGEVK